MAKIQLSNHQLVVDGKDLSDAVAAGSPHLRFQPDGSARLTVEIVTSAFEIDVDGIVEVETLPEVDDVRTVVLTKPGDMLLVGNVAKLAGLTHQDLQAATELFSEIGIKVCFFADDIDVAKLPADA